MDKYVTGMVILRILSGCIEITAAIIMIKLSQLEKALVINAGLALVGPLVLISTTAIGLVGLANKLSWDKLLWIGCGFALLMYGIMKK